MSNGWISLHRKIKEHWVWDDPKKLKWWLSILLTVNHSPKKTTIGNKLMTVDKGCSVRSLRSWAKEFNTTPKTVKVFFSMLESDQMITTKSIGISTHLKVCNYESYQDKVNTKETESKQEVNTKETGSKQELPTNNNDNNDNNSNKKESTKKPLSERETDFANEVRAISAKKNIFSPQSPEIESFINYWSESNPNGKKMKFEMLKTFDIARRLWTWKKKSREFNQNKPKNNTKPREPDDWNKVDVKY